MVSASPSLAVRFVKELAGVPILRLSIDGSRMIGGFVLDFDEHER